MQTATSRRKKKLCRETSGDGGDVGRLVEQPFCSDVKREDEKPKEEPAEEKEKEAVVAGVRSTILTFHLSDIPPL